MKNYNLDQMVTFLRTVSDITWGHYAFKNELLRYRISNEYIDEIIQNAIMYGEEWAQRIISNAGTADAQVILKLFGLSLKENDLDMTAVPRRFFTQYVRKRYIEIMIQPIDIYSTIYKPPLPEPDQVRTLLIAKEIYHYIEELHKDEIFSRTEKFFLCNLDGLKWDSTVKAIGEITAVSFAKYLTGVDFNPFMLDIILLYGYNAGLAENIFRDITKISEESI